MSWIKVETHTPDKPEVFAIADILGISSDESFGKCFRVWAWFDAHTTNGKTNGSGVSASLINRVAGVNGFAQAMVDVGWLAQNETGLTVSNFERHNGETAKQRGLTAKRVAKHTAKSNDETNGNVVSESLPREDKRREEEIHIEIPEWMPKTTWEEFKKMRIGIKAKLTPHAEKLALKKLAGFMADGYDPVEAVENAIINSWKSFYLPKTKSSINNTSMTKEEKTHAWMMKMNGLSS